MTDLPALEAAWSRFEVDRPFVQRLNPTLKALLREAFRDAWLAAEQFYRREPA